MGASNQGSSVRERRYLSDMETVAFGDLRKHTAAVLRRVQSGEVVAVTVRGETVAELWPPGDHLRRAFARRDLARVLSAQADPGLRDDLAALTGETDESDPIA